jgi:hypothetical protein
MLGLLLRRGNRLLRLEPPNIGTCLQLGDVSGVIVALITSSGGLGCMWNGRLLLLGRRLASLVKHLLFVYGSRNLRCLTSVIEVFAHILLGCRSSTEGIVVEGIIGLIKLVTKPIIRLFKIDAEQPS